MKLNSKLKLDTLTTALNGMTMIGDPKTLFNNTGSVRFYNQRSMKIYLNINLPVSKITQIAIYGNDDSFYKSPDYWNQRTGLTVNAINVSGVKKNLIPYKRSGNVNKIIDVTSNIDDGYQQIEIYLEDWNDSGGISDRTYTSIDIYGELLNFYLLKQYNKYYSIKPEYYDIYANNYIPLTLSGETIPNKQDIELFGFNNINDLSKKTTISDQIFKPVDKLYGNFDIITYKNK